MLEMRLHCSEDILRQSGEKLIGGIYHNVLRPLKAGAHRLSVNDAFAADDVLHIYLRAAYYQLIPNHLRGKRQTQRRMKKQYGNMKNAISFSAAFDPETIDRMSASLDDA